MQAPIKAWISKPIPKIKCPVGMPTNRAKGTGYTKK